MLVNLPLIPAHGDVTYPCQPCVTLRAQDRAQGGRAEKGGRRWGIKWVGGRWGEEGGKSGTQAWDAEGVYVFITVHSMRS